MSSRILQIPPHKISQAFWEASKTEQLQVLEGITSGILAREELAKVLFPLVQSAAGSLDRDIRYASLMCLLSFVELNVGYARKIISIAHRARGPHAPEADRQKGTPFYNPADQHVSGVLLDSIKGKWPELGREIDGIALEPVREQLGQMKRTGGDKKAAP
jgi:hypothetical protein